MLNQPPQLGATIIPFPASRSTSRRLLPQDRAEAIAWEKAASHTGYAQVTLSEGRGDAAEDLILVYSRGELWTVGGVAPPGRRFGLWHRTSGIKLGEFTSVRAALEAIPPGSPDRAASCPEQASSLSRA